MFPGNSAICKLVGTQRVDYLLGLSNPSWQPERVTKAKGGGDFWLYQNRFGICIGGSHPWVTGRMEKSAGMYTVLNIVHVGQQRVVMELMLLRLVLYLELFLRRVTQ